MKHLIWGLLLFPLTAVAKDYTVTSPSGGVELRLHVGTELPITYDVVEGGQVVVSGKAALSPAFSIKVKQAKKGRVSETLTPVLYRQRTVKNEANELTLRFDGGYGLVCRAYDQGVAYRFTTSLPDQTITDEQADVAFPNAGKAYLAYSTNDKKPEAMAFQNYYHETTLAGARQKLAFLPVTVDCGRAKVTMLEADVEAYPGMFCTVDARGVSATFARYPRKTDFYPWRQQEYVTETEPYIARTSAPRAFPWRAFAITTDDRQMPVNDLCYLLAAPSRVDDTEWIEGGLVSWDWWADWNLRGVAFKAGINMPTYKHYIDFAARHHLPYIILDEGWYNPKSGDMLTVIPELDLPALVAYGRERGVKIILWTVFNVLDRQLEEACRRYSQMGVAGFKVDFLDRNDQTAAEMTYRICEACARHRLTLDLHGIYPPMGLQRTWPNVVNVESIFGMEEMKWSPDSVDMPHYDVSFPFIRQMCGSTDYTPGAMRNGTKKNWKAIYDRPMSQGTRCHQLASYIIVDSYLTMLADTPSDYEREPEIADFLSLMPTRPDTTFVPVATLGEKIVTVRREAGRWYIGGQTDWTPRDVELAFDFLPEGTHRATVCRDGVNAEHNAEDYVMERIHVDRTTRLPLHMAAGGGFAIIVEHE